MRTVTASPLRPWEVAPDDFPREGSSVDKLRYFIGYAVLAPSSHNTQPWFFELHGDCLELYADRRRQLRVTDPEHRELIMSCGAALLNVRAALRRFGFAGAVDLFPDPLDGDLLARIALGAEAGVSDADRSLFDAIVRRHTHRGEFEERWIEDEIVSELREEARREGAWLEPLAGRRREAAAELVARADELQFRDPHFRRELAGWICKDGSQRADGMPASALGVGRWVGRALPVAVKAFDIGRLQAGRDRRATLGAPLLCVLGTARDGPLAWLRAGQALERVLLRACARGIAAAPMSQVIEVTDLRPRLAEIAGRRLGQPQILLRMGYAAADPPTPRRPAPEVTNGSR